MNVISTATLGMMSASERLTGVAADLANGAGNPAAAVVGQVSAGEAFKANAAVIKTQDEMMKTLLDIRV